MSKNELRRRLAKSVFALVLSPLPQCQATSEVAAWVAASGLLLPLVAANVTALLEGLGAMVLSDLAELDEEDHAALLAALPKLKRKAFLERLACVHAFAAKVCVCALLRPHHFSFLLFSFEVLSIKLFIATSSLCACKSTTRRNGSLPFPSTPRSSRSPFTLDSLCNTPSPPLISPNTTPKADLEERARREHENRAFLDDDKLPAAPVGFAAAPAASGATPTAATAAGAAPAAAAPPAVPAGLGAGKLPQGGNTKGCTRRHLRKAP